MKNRRITGEFDLQNPYDLDPLLEKIGEDSGENIHEVLEQLRWPTWMWANYDACMAKPDFFENYNRKKKRLDELMTDWEEVQGELEKY